MLIEDFLALVYLISTRKKARRGYWWSRALWKSFDSRALEIRDWSNTHRN